MRRSEGGLLLPDRADWQNGYAKHGPGPFGPRGRPATHRSRRPGAPWWMPPIKGGAARTYAVYNGATAALTAAMPKVATGTALKTLVQVSTPSTAGMRVIEWGISFDAVASTPVQCELIETGAINATVTAYNAGDVIKMNGPNDAATLMTLGAANSGFTSSAEGTITATRLGDYQLVAQQYVKQFPLGREFEVPASKFLRIRVTAAVTAGAVCYVCWEE